PYPVRRRTPADPPRSPLFPYTTLFRSQRLAAALPAAHAAVTSDAITSHAGALDGRPGVVCAAGTGAVTLAIGTDNTFHRVDGWRSEEHTSELQSRFDLVCRLLLEKKKT